MRGSERHPGALDAIDVRPYTTGDRAGLTALWHACALTRPWNDVGQDIDRCLRTPASTLLVAALGDRVVGSVMLGSDGHRGWLYYLAVDPRFQRRGLGRRLVRAAEHWLATRGISKVMLMLRPDNNAVISFYEALGYAAEERVLMAHWLQAPAGVGDDGTAA